MDLENKTAKWVTNAPRMLNARVVLLVLATLVLCTDAKINVLVRTQLRLKKLLRTVQL